MRCFENRARKQALPNEGRKRERKRGRARRTWQSRSEAWGSTVTPAHRMLPWMWAPSPTLTPSITTELITCTPLAHHVDISRILAAGIWHSIRWVLQTLPSLMGASPPMAKLVTEGPVLLLLPCRSIKLFYTPGKLVLLNAVPRQEAVLKP